jgi:hypothetical protein
MQKTGNSGRNRLRERAVINLLQFPTLRQAARATGIGLRTLHVWLGDPAFQTLYRRAKSDLLEQATGRLRAAAGKAVGVLATIAADKKENAAARVTAARTIVELGLRAHEVEDLWEQIQELKEQTSNVTTIGLDETRT